MAYELTGPRPLSRKQIREAENAKALGGMRAPHRSLASLPRGASTGYKIRKLIETSLDQHPDLADSCCPPEGEAPQQFDETRVGTLRRAILKLLGHEYGELKPGISPEIIRAWCLATGDPDAILAQWLEEGAPLGVEHIVQTTGVFPLDPEAEPTE